MICDRSVGDRVEGASSKLLLGRAFCDCDSDTAAEVAEDERVFVMMGAEVRVGYSYGE